LSGAQGLGAGEDSTLQESYLRRRSCRLAEQLADRDLVTKTLQLSALEFDAIVAALRLRYADYPLIDRFYKGRTYRILRSAYLATLKPRSGG
jgi:hypothetical protein